MRRNLFIMCTMLAVIASCGSVEQSGEDVGLKQDDWCSIATRELRPIEPGSSIEHAIEVLEQSVEKFDSLGQVAVDDGAIGNASVAVAERYSGALDDLKGGDSVSEVLGDLNFGPGADRFYDQGRLLDDEIRDRCG